MNNEREFWDENESAALISSFERMLKNKEHVFFDVDDYAQIIDHYIDSASVEMAQIALKHAMSLHPATVVLQVKEAQILAITDNTEQALSKLNVVESLEPFNSDIIRTKANIFSQLQQYDNAIQEYKKLSAEDDAEEVFSNIAFEYENMGQFKEAIQYLKKVLAINPANENALYELAYCYETSGDIESSIVYFKRYLEENPFSSAAWFNLGVGCSTLDRLEEALEAFDYAIAIEPQYASAYFNKATVLCNQEKYHEAIAAYSETLNLESPDALTFHYIGECYEKLQNFDMAIEFYFKAIETNENLSDAWAGLASVFYETGNNEKALSFVLKARRMNEANADFALLEGDICKALENYEQATAAYLVAQQNNPEDPAILMDLAEAISLDTEDISEGIEILYEAISNFPEDAALRYRLSFYLITNLQEKEGYNVLQQALEMDFSKHTEFLDMDESLLENAIILSLIEHARQSG